MNEALRIGAALEANLIEQVRYFGKSPMVNFYDETKMVRMLTGLPISTLNLIAGAKLSEVNIDHEIELALAPFKRQNVPLIWWVGPKSLPNNLGSYLEKQGLEKVFDMLGMYHQLDELEDDLDFPGAFCYKRVDNDFLLREWAETQTRAFGGQQSDTEHIYNFEKTLGTEQNSSWLRYIGYMSKEPVGVSILFQGAGTAAIFNVATVPEFRRRGIGTLMTKIPLIEAHSMGYQYSVLKATPMGVHLYRNMKFKECCQIALFFLPAKELLSNR
ncbi:MAG: GNAT family N-acetyltransferase [Candidatus Hodarchaeota archaeon]